MCKIPFDFQRDVRVSFGWLHAWRNAQITVWGFMKKKETGETATASLDYDVSVNESLPPLCLSVGKKKESLGLLLLGYLRISFDDDLFSTSSLFLILIHVVVGVPHSKTLVVLGSLSWWKSRE